MEDLMLKGGLELVLALILTFLLKKTAKQQDERDKNTQKFITNTVKQSNLREEKLINKLDDYNNSLKEISFNIKNIPVMEKRIDNIQDDLEEIKEKIGG